MCLVAVHRKLQKGEEGKLDGLELCEASLPGEKSSKRLFVCDQTNSLLYLVDTGAEVSALLKASSDTSEPTALILHAANGTTIRTYGTRMLQLNFGLRRDISWNFICVDVPYPILGADVLTKYDLLPDMKRQQLIDNTTKRVVKGQLATAAIIGISLVDPAHPLAHILSLFPCQRLSLYKNYQRSNKRTSSCI
ncbi:hypothetical protein TKK_0008806 [Trichogramma kaykai]